MRKAILFLALTLIGCSKVERNDSEATGNHGLNEAVQENSTDTQGPNVAPTAIAGVAMTYAYQFRLPAPQVATTQEKHAQQCEQMGPTRCRITGMEYHAGRDRTIVAQLAFRLVPELARRFAKQGTEQVVAAGGMLTDAKIDSSEKGLMIAAAQRDDASLAAEQKDLAGQLARSGVSAAERTQLQARQASLRDSRRSIAATKADAELELVSTPVTFTYYSGQIDPGFNDGPWLGAIKDGWANMIVGITMMLTLVIALAPWAILLGLCIWIWRRFAQKLGASPKDDA